MSSKKLFAVAAVLLTMCVLAHPALAQHSVGGCADSSPENPTVILAGMASGAYGLSELRRRFRARRQPRTK
ncbi:PExPT-CTERM protein [Bryocella elongata]|uniref:PExPT-CTERM protein n=1 Tax=Bryocella elongata TaxID=863522 RepID=UPI000CDF0EE2